MALSQSYRKLKLPDRGSRQAEAKVLAPLFARLWTRLESNELSSGEFCAWQVLLYLGRRRPLHHAVLRPRTDGTAVEGWSCSGSRIDLRQIFSLHEVIGLPLGIQRALRMFLDGDSRILLKRSVILSPEDMLALQAQGRRCVTVFVDEDEIASLHHGREAFEFTLHDLEHADKFFHQPAVTLGQTRFFDHLLHCHRRGLLNPLTSDSETAKGLDYLMADMNSHPLHMKKSLQAIVLCHFLRMEGKQMDANLSEEGRREYQALCEELLP